MNRKSILFVVHHLCTGGSEGTIAKLSVEFSKFCKVHIATFYSDKIYPTTYTYNGELHSLEEKGNSSFYPLKILKRRKFVKDLIQKKKIDVVISFLMNADLINALTCSTSHTSILSLRTSVSLIFKSSLATIIYNYIFRKVDKILLQNQENLLLLQKKFGDKVVNKTRVVPNAFDIKQITKASLEDVTIVNKTNLLISSIGRFFHIKGHFHLFKILASLKNDGFDFKLMLIGDGHLKGEYITYGSQLGLRMIEAHSQEIDLKVGDVFLIDFQTNPFKYIKHSDVFVFTSYYEGSPNALGEAMISGVPVMSSKSPVGPSDFLVSKGNSLPEETEYGVLMPVFDPNSLNSELLSNEEKVWKEEIIKVPNRLKENKKKADKAKEMMQNYDNKFVVERWKEIIDGL